MRNFSVAFLVGSLLLVLGVWSVFRDPDLRVKTAMDSYYKEGKRVMDDYSAQVERRLAAALNQLFEELDTNKDGTIERDEFKGAVVGVMAALKAMDDQRPRLPELHLPSLYSAGTILYWIQNILVLQFTFLVLLFVLEHLRALIFGDIVTLDVNIDYINAKPLHVSKEQALHYTTPLSGWYEHAKMIFFIGTGIAFLRLLLAFLFFALGCAFITIAVWGGRNRKQNPRWFHFWTTGTTFAAMMMLISLGFSRIVSHGSLAPSKDRKIIVGNHVCIVEVVYLFVHAGMPSFVSRIENLAVPLFGNVCRASEAILVNRDASESRQQTLNTILQRAASPESLPVMIFPEGTCNSQSALFQFRRGAFEARQPVQMVCFKYPYKHFNPTWNGRCVGGLDLMDLFVRMACQFVNRMEVAFLPVYQPLEVEKENPLEYASHVQRMMASVLQIPTSDAVYADYIEKAKAVSDTKKLRTRSLASSPQPEKKSD